MPGRTEEGMFFLLGKFITINRQRIYTNMYMRAEMKDIRSIH